MEKLILKDGDAVNREDYVEGKAFQLQYEGFKLATEAEVNIQLTKVLNGAFDISIIGMYIKDDLLIPQPVTI